MAHRTPVAESIGNGDPISIHSKWGSEDVLFGEANPDQRVECYKLAAAAFGPVLSEADFIERETVLSDQPLTRNGGCRVWCLYRANESSQVLSTCRTIRRTILFKDSHGVREGTGYCIASVVTNPEYRGQGLASLLLQNVTQWLDEPGRAAVSMLYSNKEHFYAKNGWTAMPAAEITISRTSSIRYDPNDQTEADIRALRNEDIADLCARDVQSLRREMETVAVAQGDIMVTILPTAELVSLQHVRANFMGLKANGKIPRRKGVQYKSNAWMYWHHDFRKQCLYIQRIRTHIEDKAARTEVMAALFSQACQEAEAWGLLRVVTWDLSPDVRKATQLLSVGERSTITEARRRETISIRWAGGKNTDDAVVTPNEAYAWN
ncbi:Nn.00g094000.m01.CDS01 [Neocucurbitaria sp. VM-36]